MRCADAIRTPVAFGRVSLMTALVLVAAMCSTSASAQILEAAGLSNAPWTVTDASAPMRAVQAYRRGDVHFLDAMSLFKALGLPAAASGSSVTAALGRASLAIDFEEGTATYSAIGSEARTEALSEGGVERTGGRYLVRLADLRRVLPEGALAFDEAMLTVMPSAGLQGHRGSPSFRLERPAAARPARGPLLYGRTRKILGGSQLSYRMTRSRRPSGEASYTGSVQLGASALGGRISGAGTLVRTGARPVSGAVRSLGYVLDFPGSALLTAAEIGRASVYRWPLRQSFDGIRLGNLPQSARHGRHPAAIKGVAEPHAMVTASTDGIVVDQVQADERGHYVLRVPARYGTSHVDLEILPAGGGVPVVERRRLFIAEEMAPPGRLHWDMAGGRSRIGRVPLALFQARYGLSPGLTARGGMAFADSFYTATAGATRNFWGFASAGAEVSYPEAAAHAALRLFRGSWRFAAEMELAEKPGLVHYRRRLQAQAGASLRRISLHASAGRYASFAGAGTLNASASGTIRLGRGTTLLLSIRHIASPRLQWKSALTRYLSLGRLRMRTGLQGEGGRYGDADFAGLTTNAYLRRVSFGARIGYDFTARRPSASLTLRMDAPWMSFNSHSEFDPHNPHQRQSLYGAMELDRGVRLARQPRTHSSAVLRAFVDHNRNGRMEADEPVLPDLELEVLRARVARQQDGSARADYLLPGMRYEVVIDATSITAPNLVPATGTAFGFVPDPGETKRIDIPVYENTAVEGVIEDLPSEPPARAIVVFFREAEEAVRAAVSPQGTFTAVLAPGTYRIEVHDVITRNPLPGFTQSVEVLQDLNQTLRIRLR